MDGGDVRLGCHDEGEEVRGQGGLLAFDNQLLGTEAAILRRALEPREESGVGRRLARIDARGRLGDDPVNAAARMIAKGILVRTADARLGVVTAPAHAGGRVVLDDKVLPVGEPDGPVGADGGEDRRHPFVGRSDDVVAILGHVAGALGDDVHKINQLHGRLADHRRTLQTGRQLGGVDEIRTSRGGVAAHHVDLAKVRGDGMGLVDEVDLLR